jgi:hypothetical protein
MVGLAWVRDTPRTGAAGLLCARVDRASAIGVGAGIHGVLQPVWQGHPIGPAPRQPPSGGAFPRANPERNVLPDERAQERVPRAAFVKFAKDQPDDMLHLGIRLIDHLARGVMDTPDGEREAQCPPACFLPGALTPPLSAGTALSRTHRAFESQQQAIIAVPRIIDPVEVRDGRPEQGTALQRLVPIFGGARQARHLPTHNEADVLRPDFRHQPLKALAPLSTGARPAGSISDHQHPGLRPAPGDGPTHQAVLQPCGLLVRRYLLRGRLPRTHDRQPVPVPWEECRGIPLPALTPVRPRHRRPPPRSRGAQLALQQLAEQPQEALAIRGGQPHPHPDELAVT